MIVRIGGNFDSEFPADRLGKAVNASAQPAVYCINLRRVSSLLYIEDNFNVSSPEFKDELLLGYFWVWPDFLFILAFPFDYTQGKLTTLRIGFVLGLFFWAGRLFHSHNPFVKKRLRSFLALRKLGLNWVCFA